MDAGCSTLTWVLLWPGHSTRGGGCVRAVPRALPAAVGAVHRSPGHGFRLASSAEGADAKSLKWPRHRAETDGRSLVAASRPPSSTGTSAPVMPRRASLAGQPGPQAPSFSRALATGSGPGSGSPPNARSSGSRGGRRAAAGGSRCRSRERRKQPLPRLAGSRPLLAGAHEAEKLQRDAGTRRRPRPAQRQASPGCAASTSGRRQSPGRPGRQPRSPCPRPSPRQPSRLG